MQTGKLWGLEPKISTGLEKYLKIWRSFGPLQTQHTLRTKQSAALVGILPSTVKIAKSNSGNFLTQISSSSNLSTSTIFCQFLVKYNAIFWSYYFGQYMRSELKSYVRWRRCSILEVMFLNVYNSFVWKLLAKAMLIDIAARSDFFISIKISRLNPLSKYYISCLLLCNLFLLSSTWERAFSSIQKNNIHAEIKGKRF